MTTGVACPTPILRFCDNAGNPAVGGSVLTQVGGVNAATYSDVNLTTALPNPIPLNSRGEVSTAAGTSSQLFLTPNVAYTFTLYDVLGNQLNQAIYVNGVQTNITQGSIGQTLWPQTASEAAAGVTPVNYFYPPGDARRYGAVGNGIVDDTTALQNCFAATAGSGVTAFLPGSYKITSTLTLSSGLTIVGVQGATKITFSGSMAAAVVLSGSSVSNICISGLEIVGDTSSNASAVNYGGGIYLVDATDCEIYQCYVHGFVQFGIAVQTSASANISSDIDVHDNRLDSISSIGTTYVAGIHGIRFADGCSNCNIFNNRVTNIGTAANGTGGIGIAVYQLNTGWTTPDNISVLDNYVYNCCQHGIIYYASQLTTAEFHPGSRFEGNFVSTTGTAQWQGPSGGLTNQLGNGIYCEMLIPGAIVGNTIYNTHVAAVSTTIAEASISVMSNNLASKIASSISVTGNSVMKANRDAFRFQYIDGLTFSGNVGRSISRFGLRLDGVTDFSIGGLTLSDNSSTQNGITMGTGGAGDYADGCQNGRMAGVSIHGFGVGISETFATNVEIDAALAGFTTEGLSIATCTDCRNRILTPTNAAQAVVSSGASVRCYVELSAPARATFSSPYVNNAGTGVIIDAFADAITGPTQSTWAVGDRLTLRQPTASNPDYTRCVTAGTPGTWKTGAALSA